MARSLPVRDLSPLRRTFLEGGELPRGVLPDTILQSWQRCRRIGLDLQQRPSIEPAGTGWLRELRERNERLWRSAAGELDWLAEDARDTRSLVLLTDADGWILDAKGHAGFLDRAGQVALQPGACWNERGAGTNAIGTALVEGRSVVVQGGEHYFDPHRILSCSAVPIRDPFGHTVGVLDLSGESSVDHAHALGLVRRAVASIEHRWFEDGLPGCEILRLHRDPALLGGALEGVLAFRNGRLVAASRAGLALFGLDVADLGRTSFGSLFDESLQRLRDDGLILDRHGRPLHGQVDRDDTAPVRRTIVPTSTTMAASAQGPFIDAALELRLQRATRILNADLPVLLRGETGVGKEVFARELHRRSRRAARPFVAVNCAALPEGLIESELFGYEEGAFTGARRQGSSGLLRQAQGGVLFLDEIGDMPLALQPRLLRVLQERELQPLGGGKPVKLDFALICATHAPLEQALAEGRFRADLYYRITHHCEPLPALREQDNRGAIIDALWQRVAAGRRLTNAARSALVAHAWPGNWRELDACLRTLVALSDPGEDIDVDQLPAHILHPVSTTASAAAPAGASANSLDALTEAAMRAMLDRFDGNVSRAARELGVHRSTLYRRLGIERGSKPH